LISRSQEITVYFMMIIVGLAFKGYEMRDLGLFGFTEVLRPTSALAGLSRSGAVERIWPVSPSGTAACLTCRAGVSRPGQIKADPSSFLHSV
jgi:hypothetical protein